MSKKKLYETLGVEESASGAEIKAAYRKQARKHHPDKGGDKAAFQAVAKAYQVLKMPETRKRYDETGDESPNVQSRESRVVAQLIEGFLQLIEEVDVTKADIIESTKAKIAATMQANRKLEKDYHQKIQRYEKAMARILRKDAEPNVLSAALLVRIAHYKRSIENVHEQLEDLKAMLVLLKSYYCEAPPKEIFTGGSGLNQAEWEAMRGLGFRWTK